MSTPAPAGGIHIPQPPPGTRAGPVIERGAAKPAPAAPAVALPPSLLPPAFVEAWVHAEHRVCRRVLPAYSFHSAFMLGAINSPFAFETLPEGYRITWEDLWLAIAAVLTPYGGAFRSLAAWRCVATQRLHRLDLAREVAAFRAWQNDYLSGPEVFSSEGDGRELTAPGILTRVVFLQRHLHGYTDARIWTMGIGEALWLHATALEQLSEHVSLLDDEQGQLFALLKRIQEGTADASELPGQPPPPGDLLSRAATALGLSPS